MGLSTAAFKTFKYQKQKKSISLRFGLIFVLDQNILAFRGKNQLSCNHFGWKLHLKIKSRGRKITHTTMSEK
jgi:hypothetical protein